MYYCHLELTCVIHNIMRLKFQKILTLLLLSAFLATSTAGNVLGCTECAGGEWSQSVNTSVDKCCCTEDLINNPEDSHEVPALHQLGDEQQGSCSDCSTPQGSTVFSKRTKRIPTAVHYSDNLKQLPAESCRKCQTGCWQPCTATADENVTNSSCSSDSCPPQLIHPSLEAVRRSTPSIWFHPAF